MQRTGREPVLTVDTAEQEEKPKQQTALDSTHVAVGLWLTRLITEKPVVLI